MAATIADTELAKKVLIELWPEHVQAIDEETLEEVIGGQREFIPLQGGRNVDISSVLQDLAAAVAIVEGMILAARWARTRYGRKPTPRDIRDRVEESQEELLRLVDERVAALVAERVAALLPDDGIGPRQA